VLFRSEEHFTGGSLIQEPIGPPTKPMKVNTRSIGFSKITKVCEIADQDIELLHIKSSFMNNI